VSWTTKVQKHQFDIHGIKLAALEWGGGRLPVIALHGWLDNAASFIPLAPYLDDIHLLALDLPGHGHSEHLPAAACYHLADNCRWVVALADAMGWDQFVLLGHSMGAAAATITAAAVPQRVAGLALIDGLGPMALSPEQEIERLQQLFTMEHTRQNRAFNSRETAVRLRQRMGRFPISSEAARLIIERGMEEVEEGFVWRHDPRLKGPNTHYYAETQAEGLLRAIETETLLISAEDGAFKDWRGFEKRKASVSRLEHHILPGRHHLHMENPQAVAAILNAYFGNIR